MPRARTVAYRILVAHLLAYPVATAWALGSIPVIVVGIAARAGILVDDQVIAHRVLLRVVWPALGSFVLVHLAGVVWALGRDERRARRTFVGAMALLGGVALVGGGASWVWLITR